MLRILIALVLVFGATGVARADDSRVGYYYPAVTSEEVFNRTFDNLPPADREVRVAFITEITKAQLAAPETPRFSIFAKGADAEHMIIVGLDDEVFRSLYRARAVMAQLTSNFRGTDMFIQSKIQYVATFYDLAKIFGFKDIVITDGLLWSHRVSLP